MYHWQSFWLFLVIILQYSCCSSQTTPLTGCNARMDLVFILDSSESVLDSDPIGQVGYTWTAIKNFARGVVRHLPVGGDTKVATIRYGTHAKVDFHLSQHHNLVSVEDAILSMPHMGGNTNTAGALRLARTQTFSGDFGARGDARNVIVYVGDGIDNVESDKTEEELGYIKQHVKAEIFTIGISKEIHTDKLEYMASHPADTHFLHAPELRDLDLVQKYLVHRICGLPDPEITTTPEPDCPLPGCRVCDDVRCHVCHDGKYLVGLNCEDCMGNCRVCKDTVSCDRCMSGWFWEPALQLCKECELIADLALVIDNSGSIRDKNPEDMSYDNYQILKDFVSQLLDKIDIGPNATRVGTVKFSSKSQLVFHLDENKDRLMIQSDIQEMPFGGGHTNISGGIRMARTEIFHEEYGDRPDIGNIAILITDGESTIDKNLTIPEANLAKGDGITLFVVGITDDINEKELKAIASSPIDTHYFNSTDIRNLEELMDGLIKQVCMPDALATIPP